MSKKWIYLLVLGATAILTVGCSTSKKNNLPAPCAVHQDTPPPITIWVHGTKLIGAKFLPSFFYCHPGLTCACDLDEKYHHRIMAQTLIETDPEKFPSETFYLFGWSGALSFQERKQAAQDLYAGLKKVAADYKKKYHKKPYIRIITHSHGGNVVLNLPAVKDANHDIVIAELILLACPIQDYTKNNSADPMFQNIVSLYSTLDALQILDPQGMYSKEVHEMHNQYEKCAKTPLFSQRIFTPAPKIIQTKIKINGRGIFHVEFMLQRFLRQLPNIVTALNEYKKENIKSCSKKLLINIAGSKPIKIKETR